jgi:uncharacterized repeat protein (TIGR01451 family)
LTLDVTAGTFEENVVATNSARVSATSITARTSNSTLAIINLYPFVLTVTSSQETVSRGGDVNFRVFYKNEGEAVLTNVILRVVLPAGTTLVNASRPGYDADKNVLTWTIGNVAPEEMGEINVLVRIDRTVAPGTILTLSAAASYFDAFAERQIDVTSYKSVTVEGSLAEGAEPAATGFATFFPDTLFGWLLLLLLLLVIAVLIKRAVENRRDETTTVVQ